MNTSKQVSTTAMPIPSKMNYYTNKQFGGDALISYFLK